MSANMGIKQIPNRNLLPNLDKEGSFSNQIPTVDEQSCDKSVHQRMFSHHTLTSARRVAFYNISRAPKDSLDLLLSSTYNHSKGFFPDKEDFHLQKETMGELSWRRLKNTVDKMPVVVIPLGHPLKWGGLTERRSPHNTKLMNSSHHSAKTVPGYSRQPAGGNIFYY